MIRLFTGHRIRIKKLKYFLVPSGQCEVTFVLLRKYINLTDGILIKVDLFHFTNNVTFSKL